MSEPKMPTPEEMAKMQKSRTESDAELIKEGAEYVADEDGNTRLDVTKEQKVDLGFEENDEYVASGGEIIAIKSKDGLEYYKGMYIGISDSAFYKEHGTYQRARIIEFDKKNPHKVLVKPDGAEAIWIDSFEAEGIKPIDY